MPSRRPPAPLLSSGGLAPRHTEAGRTRRPTPLILLLFACRSVAVETEACVIQTDRLTRTRTEGRIVELLEVRHGVHRGLGLFGRLHLDVAVARKTGTGRDELSEDDVLLEAEQRVGLAWIAASVRTRVVSWKDAADSQDSVASEALVIPISSGRPEAGLLPSDCTRRFSDSKRPRSASSPGSRSASPASMIVTRRSI